MPRKLTLKGAVRKIKKHEGDQFDGVLLAAAEISRDPTFNVAAYLKWDLGHLEAFEHFDDGDWVGWAEALRKVGSGFKALCAEAIK